MTITIKRETITVSSKKTQPARGWNATDQCYSTLYPDMGARLRFLGKSAVVPCRMLALLLTKPGMSDQILARRHTQINTQQSYGFVTSVTNK